MEQPNERSRSHLFTIRVWEEEIEADSTEWRGKVQLFPGGEVRYFREWETLVPLLRAMLTGLAIEPDIQQL
jgi:hypothetical protein